MRSRMTLFFIFITVGVVLGAGMGVAVALPGTPGRIDGAQLAALFIQVAGAGFAGGIAGAILAAILKGTVAGDRTACPSCRSGRAVPGHRSFWSGKQVPNRCPDCSHEWQEEASPREGGRAAGAEAPPSAKARLRSRRPGRRGIALAACLVVVAAAVPAVILVGRRLSRAGAVRGTLTVQIIGPRGPSRPARGHGGGLHDPGKLTLRIGGEHVCDEPGRLTYAVVRDVPGGDTVASGELGDCTTTLFTTEITVDEAGPYRVDVACPTRGLLGSATFAVRKLR